MVILIYTQECVSLYILPHIDQHKILSFFLVFAIQMGDK